MTSKPRTRLAAALTAAAAIGVNVPDRTRRSRHPADARSAPGNVVVAWNRTLLSLVQTPGAQPATIHPTRDFAIMSAAVYDAVDATAPTTRRYRTAPQRPAGASTLAAAAQAAHDVLVATFPGVHAHARRPARHRSHRRPGRPGARRRRAGRRRAAAAAMLQARAADGAQRTPPPYETTGAPGDYRPTPPAFAAPVFTHWGAVTPFVLRRGDQFRPRAAARRSPAPRTPRRSTRCKSLGQDTSTTRTADQTTIAKFWAGPIQNYWNDITDEVVLARHASWTSRAHAGARGPRARRRDHRPLRREVHVRLWRPVTAIRLADTDGNPQTTADPTWTPLATTPADPSYPGAHSPSAPPRPPCSPRCTATRALRRHLADAARRHPDLRHLPRRRH